MNHSTAAVSSTASEFRDTDQFLEVHQIGDRIPGGFVAGAHPIHRRGILLVVPRSFEIDANWSKAQIHIDDIEMDGEKDYRLPTRLEGLVLDENLSPRKAKISAFQEGGDEAFDLDTWYWLSQQYDFHSDYAWGQDFNVGYQDGLLKGYADRVRAVRTFFI